MLAFAAAVHPSFHCLKALAHVQVCAVLQGGAFAAEAVIKEGGVIKLPKEVDLVSAAGLPVAFGTAHLALKERCKVKPGEGLLLSQKPKPSPVMFI